MKYRYVIGIYIYNDVAVDELVDLMTQQMRISTRRRRCNCKLVIWGESITIYFRYKDDCIDFSDAFEKIKESFIIKHEFITNDGERPYMEVLR